VPESRLTLSGYRAVWFVALFDLPVKTREARRDYARFRKELRKRGFSMLQYSVYARFLPSEEAWDAYRRQVVNLLPPQGEVRLLAITDRQFGKMETYRARKLATSAKRPGQLLLF